MGLIKLMSTENPDLRQHLINCKYQKNYMTFLSSKFSDNVLKLVYEHITNKIVTEINRGPGNGRFGLCVDSTTDLTAVHQTSVVVRYVNVTNRHKHTIVERTINICECRNGTGKAIFDTVKRVLEEVGLAMGTNIVGCSFDGANNMRSPNKGVYHFLCEENEHCVYCWCYAHRFNLCVEHSYDKSIKFQQIIALSNDAAVFLRLSPKRMDVWREVATSAAQYNSRTRLHVIGQTRWSTKNSMLKNIISTDMHLFVLIKTFFKISIQVQDDVSNNRALDTVLRILNEFLKYDTCLLSYLFYTVSSELNKVTIKVQESGLNLLVAMKTIKECREHLNYLQENLHIFAKYADIRIRNVNISLEKDDFVRSNGSGYIKIKRPSSVQEREDIQSTVIQEVDAYIEDIKEEIDKFFFNEFNDADDIYKELSLLDLPSLKQLSNNGTDNLLLSTLSLKKLCANIGVKDDRGEREVISELLLLSREYNGNSNIQEPQHQRINWSYFGDNLTTDEHGDDEASDEIDDDGAGETELSQSQRLPYIIDDEIDYEDAGDPENYISNIKTCYCIQCILDFLTLPKNQFRFKNVYNLYIYVATLPSTQTKCERDFSTLKIIKNRLRAQITQENLKHVMLISLCRDIFHDINLTDLTDEIVARSKWAKKLLSS